MRSTAGTPAPRSRRVGKVSQNNRAPNFSASRAAARKPGPRVASPPIRITVESPDRRAPSTLSVSATSEYSCSATISVASAPSDQETSAGRMSVEMWWPARANASASTASIPMSPGVPVRRTQPETVSATESISDSSGAS